MARPTRRRLLRVGTAGAAATLAGCPGVHVDPAQTITLSASAIVGFREGEGWRLAVTTAISYSEGMAVSGTGTRGGEVVAYDRRREELAAARLRESSTSTSVDEEPSTPADEAPSTPTNGESATPTMGPPPETTVRFAVPALPAWLSFRFEEASRYVYVTAYRHTGERPTATVETDDWEGTRLRATAGPLPTPTDG